MESAGAAVATFGFSQASSLAAHNMLCGISTRHVVCSVFKMQRRSRRIIARACLRKRSVGLARSAPYENTLTAGSLYSPAVPIGKVETQRGQFGLRGKLKESEELDVVITFGAMKLIRTWGMQTHWKIMLSQMNRRTAHQRCTDTSVGKERRAAKRSFFLCLWPLLVQWGAVGFYKGRAGGGNEPTNHPHVSCVHNL